MKRQFVLIVLTLGILACRSSARERRSNLYPTATPDATQTPIIQTVIATKVVQITLTIAPTFTITPVRQLCVSAIEAVHLRPSPTTENNIAELKNGAVVIDLGGRQDGWMYVEWNDKRGWINGKYVVEC